MKYLSQSELRKSHVPFLILCTKVVRGEDFYDQFGEEASEEVSGFDGREGIP